MAAPSARSHKSIEQIAPLTGYWEGPIDDFVGRLDALHDLTACCSLVSAESFKDDSGLFGSVGPHRFVIAQVRYAPAEDEGPVADFYIRVDRRPKKYTSPTQLLSYGGLTLSNDRVTTSFGKGFLLDLSKRRHSKGFLRLTKPVALRKFQALLDAIGKVLTEYKITEVRDLSHLDCIVNLNATTAPNQENCWLVASVTMHYLRTLGEGKYDMGGPLNDDWAPDARLRIEKHLQAAGFYNTDEMVHSSAMSKRPNSSASRHRDPPKPKYLFGREVFLQEALAALIRCVESNDKTGIAIRGPGGIGKTTVASALYHHPSLADRTPESRRLFVQCNALDTCAKLLHELCAAVGAEARQGNPLDVLLSALRKGGPTLLFLDNAETFWLSADQSSVKEALDQVFSIKNVHLVLTIRGLEQPPFASWAKLAPLGTLDAVASRSLFLAISTDVIPDPALDALLNEVDHVPLAVTLLARLSQMTGDTDILDLHQQFKRLRTSLLTLDDASDPQASVEASVELSLSSLPVQKNPYVLRVLSVVAFLPLGISMPSACEMLNISLDCFCGARNTLKRLSLAYDGDDNWLTTLAPIRDHVRAKHPILNLDRSSVLRHHMRLAKTGTASLGDATYAAVVQSLRRQKDNVYTAAEHVLTSQEVDEETLLSVLGFSNFLHSTQPDSKLLESIFALADNEHTVRIRHRLLFEMARMQTRLFNYKEAEALFKKARSGYLDDGDCLKATQCLKKLGEVDFARKVHDKGRGMFTEARQQFIAHNDQLGAAQCLFFLGEISLILNEWKAAQSELEEARSEFCVMGNKYEETRCLRTLGIIYQIQSNYESAKAAFSQCRIHCSALGDLFGEALSLASLGDLLCEIGELGQAEEMVEEARTAFIAISNPQAAAVCLSVLADIWRRRGELSKAHSASKAACADLLAVDDRFGSAIALMYHGEVALMRGNYVAAQLILAEARDEFQALHNRLVVAKCLRSLCENFIMQGDLHSARRIYLEASSEFTAVGNRLGEVQCLQCQGNISRMSGDFDKARAELSEARKELVALDDRRGAAQCLQSLGDLSRERGESDTARSSLEAAMGEFRSMGDRWGAAQCLQSLGLLAATREDYHGAKSGLTMAGNEFAAIGDDPRASQCFRAIADAGQTLGELLWDDKKLETPSFTLSNV